ncbi:hypothetical protein DERF_012045 [Dermatophagoides farinae]|uniref:C2H2-type domain-containing protein n=1 Tax=Dermatophagoides farinae TaxID=6954 RepID=A0A922L1C4_DERFA|nr:hypothetical protein DERF_012045 [Dermatophagoides farinae]
MNGRYNRFSCPYQGCEKNYSSSKMCKHHISSIHHNEQIRCPIQSCGKVYRYPRCVSRHLYAEHYNEYNEYSPAPSSSLSTPSTSTSQHLKPIKDDNDKYQCPYYTTIYSHMKKKHKDEWPPKTSSSTSSSTPSYSTSSHLKPIKDNNKNYQCPYHGCQKIVG